MWTQRTRRAATERLDSLNTRHSADSRLALGTQRLTGLPASLKRLAVFSARRMSSSDESSPRLSKSLNLSALFPRALAAAAGERERALAAERERALAAERALPALQKQLAQLTLKGGAVTGSTGSAARGAVPAVRSHLISARMYQKPVASGFALAESGLNAPVGWMLAAAAFMPVGRIADEVTLAAAEAAAATNTDFLAFRAGLDLAGGLVLSCALEDVTESWCRTSGATT